MEVLEFLTPNISDSHEVLPTAHHLEVLGGGCRHGPWLTQFPLGLIKGLLKAKAGIRVGELEDEGVSALGPRGAQLQLGWGEGKRIAQCLLL